MAQPTFTPFEVNSACDHTTMNAAFSDVVSKSASVDGTNIRDEGLDRNAIATGAILNYLLTDDIGSNTAYPYGTTNDGTYATWYDITGFQNIQTPAGMLRIDNGGAGFTVDVTKQIARVRASVEVRRIANIGHFTNPVIVAFQFHYKLTGVPFTTIATSYRRLNYAYTPAGPVQRYNKCSVTMSTMLVVSGTYDYIDLRVVNVGDTLEAAADYLFLSEAFMDLEVKEH